MKKLEVSRYTLKELEELAKRSVELQLGMRFLAVYNVAKGGTSRDSASEILTLTHSRVCFWVNQLNQYGLEGLKSKKKSGRPPKLSEKQLKRIEAVVEESPEKYGFNTATWTGPVLTQWIENELGIKYKKAAIYTILKNFSSLSKKPKVTIPKQANRDKKKNENS